MDLSRFGSPIRLDITGFAEKVRSDKWLLLAACVLIDFIGVLAQLGNSLHICGLDTWACPWHRVGSVKEWPAILFLSSERLSWSWVWESRHDIKVVLVW